MIKIGALLAFCSRRASRVDKSSHVITVIKKTVSNKNYMSMDDAFVDNGSGSLRACFSIITMIVNSLNESTFGAVETGFKMNVPVCLEKQLWIF